MLGVRIRESSGGTCSDVSDKCDPQSQRIDIHDRATHAVHVGIQAAAEANRISFYVSSATWVVVPEVVVVKPGLCVEVLPRQS